ncbi:methyl-accepting chemotaxis protein [Shewanella livingstonensis]|uniref:Methyl-accepting chemotaxis protein n=1 Tax=Shewanella livingstonensis TaxID=150120 RepID=A0A3G8LXH9_9GAMM|nr:methyl-accepting chemotaxis protein [Shewanella livingstonensis]AZG74331.1 methyl-accepting chemotaxis protein [Shewanella livingstonensis]
MKALSIKVKLLWITSALFIATVVVLSSSLWVVLKDKNNSLAAEVEVALQQEINDKLSARAGEYGERIAGFINEAYRIPYSFAGLLEQTAQKDPLSRERVESSLAAVLQKNEQISSMYVHFEPNGYDYLDDSYLDGSSHSVVNAGTLEVYNTRGSDGLVQQQSVANAEDKYISTLNEFGVREAEWYLCAKDSKKPCLMEPYLYEITPGNKVLMTSLTAAVVVDNQFKGIVGVDINLPIFQTMIMQLSKSLYQGQAKVTLVSQKGFVVAASHYTKFARPLSESVKPELAKKLLALNNTSGFVNEPDSIAVGYPIAIPIANATWSLIIEVPKSQAFMAVNNMNDSMTEMEMSLGGLLLMIGIAVTVIAVIIISLVIRSIIAPLSMIQARVENLASAEGDLTQAIEVDAHAELIALGSGINAFIAKLRHLISELKILADRSQQESIKSADIAKLTRESVNRQYGEIESVVTAVNQMSATALEVAKASEQTAMETESMTVNVKDGQSRLTQAMVFVEGVSTDSEKAQQAVGMVSQSSANISRILEVISAIAEQTNLLALNAAIEAARAGEQGRGFAVVADEVRTLASRTQKSTNEISTLIESLQKEVKNASSIIDKGAQGAQKAVEQTQLALQSLNAIVEQINEVSGQVTHIATAAEEQSAVTEEVNRNITGISDSASELSQLADSAQQSSDSLAKLVHEQHQQLGKLRT